MPFYYEIDETTEQGKRTAKGLTALRDVLDKAIPKRNLSDTLLLATWNIREFDTAKYGPRTDESLYYIAEIISHFDLVAVQEVRDDLKALKRVKSILGSWWDHVVTDVCAGAEGNGERLAFLYDNRKVRFSGLAGEIVMPPIKKVPAVQFARTPFLCGFKAGWSKFNLCTVHIIYGKSDPEDPKRVAEIKNLAQFISKRALDQAKMEENMVLLGDFNIFSVKDATMTAITDNNFKIPDALKEIPGSNVDKNKHYDQIAFMPNPMTLEFSGKAGVFNYYDTVYKKDDEAVYLAEARAAYEAKQLEKPESERKTLAPGEWPGGTFKEWRSYQMSDHLPMWIELNIDFSRKYLGTKTGENP